MAEFPAPDRDQRYDREGPREARVRRISYFMLFRLAILVVVTLLATLSVANDPDPRDYYAGIGWMTLGLAFGLTIIFARLLPRVQNLERFAFVQTAVDIVLSAVVVQLTGGLDSSFVFLYLIAILGSALMGTRAHCLAAAGACALIFSSLAGLQMSGAIAPEYPPGIVPATTTSEYVAAIIRSLVAIGAVGALAVQLNTQLWRSSEQLASLRALNHYIVRSLGSGLATLDPQMRVAFLNPQAARLIGREAAACTGLPAETLWPGIESALAAGQEGEDGQYRFELVNEAGRVFGCSVGPLRDGEGGSMGWVLHFQDITDLRQIEDELRRKERLAAVGGLAASVAHEVRNPLAAMAGSAELIDQAQLGDEDRRLLAIIRREADRLERMVSDMLSFTRPRPLEFQAVDLARVLRDVVEAFRADPANAQVELVFEGPERAHAQLDRASITQLTWNLLRNAAEATAHQGRVELRLTELAQGHRIEVIDDGRGIDPEMMQRIFEPFQSGKLEGFGFGLALVKRIVGDHGGRIEVESEAGAGARFCVELPEPTQSPGSGVFRLS